VVATGAKPGEECSASARAGVPVVVPAYHWTESKLLVHALYCFLALLLLRIVLLDSKSDTWLSGRLPAGAPPGHTGSLVVYANGAAQRVLTQRSPEQEELFVALNLRPLAEQLGNTVLDLYSP